MLILENVSSKDKKQEKFQSIKSQNLQAFCLKSLGIDFLQELPFYNSIWFYKEIFGYFADKYF